MVSPPDDDHDCGWKVYAQALQAQIAEVLEAQKAQQAELEALKRKLFGKRGEKMPPMGREARRDQKADPQKAKKKAGLSVWLPAALVALAVGVGLFTGVLCFIPYVGAATGFVLALLLSLLEFEQFR